jgi:hypothetical protein
MGRCGQWSTGIGPVPTAFPIPSPPSLSAQTRIKKLQQLVEKANAALSKKKEAPAVKSAPAGGSPLKQSASTSPAKAAATATAAAPAVATGSAADEPAAAAVATDSAPTAATIATESHHQSQADTPAEPSAESTPAAQ